MLTARLACTRIHKRPAGQGKFRSLIVNSSLAPLHKAAMIGDVGAGVITHFFDESRLSQARVVFFQKTRNAVGHGLAVTHQVRKRL